MYNVSILMIFQLCHSKLEHEIKECFSKRTSLLRLSLLHFFERENTPTSSSILNYFHTTVISIYFLKLLYSHTVRVSRVNKTDVIFLLGDNSSY